MCAIRAGRRQMPALRSHGTGLRPASLAAIGNDDFGKLLKKTLEDNQVKMLCPELTDKAVTTLAFVTLYEGGERSFTFVRKPGADIMLDAKDITEKCLQIQKCCTQVLSECPRTEPHRSF